MHYERKSHHTCWIKTHLWELKAHICRNEITNRSTLVEIEMTNLKRSCRNGNSHLRNWKTNIIAWIEKKTNLHTHWHEIKAYLKIEWNNENKLLSYFYQGMLVVMGGFHSSKKYQHHDKHTQTQIGTLKMTLCINERIITSISK